MVLLTILGYLVLLLLVMFGISGLPASIIGGLAGRWAKAGQFAGIFLGSLITWLGLNWLWFWIFGENIPVLAFALCFIVIGLHGWLEGEKLNNLSKRMMGGEQWVLFLVCLYLIIYSDKVNWV